MNTPSDARGGPNLTAGGVNRPVRFALHIRVLFTAAQQACMAGMMDLFSHDDVKANAEGIYDRLADQSMPADDSGPWPTEWITLFRRWIDEGCAE